MRAWENVEVHCKNALKLFRRATKFQKNSVPSFLFTITWQPVQALLHALQLFRIHFQVQIAQVHFYHVNQQQSNLHRVYQQSAKFRSLQLLLEIAGTASSPANFTLSTIDDVAR